MMEALQTHAVDNSLNKVASCLFYSVIWGLLRGFAVDVKKLCVKILQFIGETSGWWSK